MGLASSSTSATGGTASDPAARSASTTGSARPTAPQAPTIAVVICTRDRPRALLETLDSVWAQSRRPDELVIIDDGRMPERLLDPIAVECHRLGIAWRYRRTDSPGLTRGRNLAAELASSDVLQYLDDDATCDVNFLMEVERVMRDPAVAGATATVREPAFEGLSARLYQLGYRVAGWWSVAPRGLPPGRRPRVLDDAGVAVRARWLSGAAMALRREVVLRWRFDEGLTEYALGEDREFGYRLSPHFWLVQARRAVVRHRREESARTNSRRLGFMTGRNYLHILSKTCAPRLGDWAVIAWSLTVVAAMHALWAVVGNRRDHLAQLRGMIAGVAAFLAESWIGRTRSTVSQSLRRAGTPPMRVADGISSSGERCVLFLTTDLQPGGAELMLASLVRHLPRFGVKPVIACLKDGGGPAAQCREEGTPVIENLLRYKLDLRVLARIRRLLAEHRIDAIVAAQSGGDRMFWAALAGRLSGVPVVVWSHWLPRPGDRHFEPANRALYRLVDVFVALGEEHRQALIRHAFVPAGRVAVIPNGIELGRFSPAGGRDAARERLGLSADQVAVAMIANLRPEKRHDVFIAAAKRASATNPSLRFFIVGEGPHGDAVRTAAAGSGLSSEVLRLLGRRADVADLLPAFDMSCLCSEVECFSVTMLEAAAAGVAFIGPEVGCLGEFLTHLQTGWAIRPADVPSLTDAIAALAVDAGLRRRLTEAARDRVAGGFTMNRTAEAFAGLLRAVGSQ
jgi:glycosyltransferase involved in cell wall biosynthesis/GT2 family glycosyltransferase